MRRSWTIVVRYMTSLALSFFLAACASTGKEAPVRHPAALANPESYSLLRARLLSLKDLPTTCPDEIRSISSSLWSERFSAEPCPKNLQEGFELARRSFSLEEQGLLDEILNSQCRLPVLRSFEKSLLALQDELTSAKLSSVEARGVRDGVAELVLFYLPRARWQKHNGDYLISEEQLVPIGDLLERGCSVHDLEIEIIYRLLGSLEELNLLVRDKDQTTRVGRLLQGLRKVSDEKVREMFFPNDKP